VYTDLKLAAPDDPTSPAPIPADDVVSCDTHGEGQETYVCEHLLANPKQEWFSDVPSGEKPWPDAWCAGCDEVFQEEGEWNERNEGRIKIELLCHHCYESLRKQDLTV
jgi:hypothetical protein